MQCRRTRRCSSRLHARVRTRRGGSESERASTRSEQIHVEQLPGVPASTEPQKYCSRIVDLRVLGTLPEPRGKRAEGRPRCVTWPRYDSASRDLRRGSPDAAAGGRRLAESAALTGGWGGRGMERVGETERERRRRERLRERERLCYGRRNVRTQEQRKRKTVEPRFSFVLTLKGFAQTSEPRFRFHCCSGTSHDPRT